jgi:hypothetical protein
VQWDAVGVRRTNRDWDWVSATTAAATRVVAVAEMERVEVQLPVRDKTQYAGYQIVKGVKRSLPVGSSLDAKAGVFYWQPAPGFLGSYDLLFVADAPGGPEQTRVRMVVGPPMRMAIDTPRGGTVGRSFQVAGWALDLAAPDGSGVDTVHMWAYPARGGEPIFLGVASVGDRRPDVGATYGAQFAPSSYSLQVDRLGAGPYDIVVYIHRAATNRFDAAQTVRVTVMR